MDIDDQKGYMIQAEQSFDEVMEEKDKLSINGKESLETLFNTLQRLNDRNLLKMIKYFLNM